MYRGGPLSVKFYPSVAQSIVDSIRTSLGATVSWEYADSSGIFEDWQISGFPVDSLAAAFSHDLRVKFAEVERMLSPDSLVIAAIPRGTRSAIQSYLAQNYPNPFNPTTTIRYALPQRSHVMLTVFNTLGQQVANLVDAVQEPGEHSVRFDGSGLASGVYYYRLRAGDCVRTMKLAVIR